MLGIFALIFVIVSPIFIYRAAKQNNHNAIFWSLLALFLGVGVLIVIPALIGMVIAMVMFSQGASEADFEKAVEIPSVVIGYVALAISIGGILLINRHVNKIPEQPSASHPPSPPTHFD
jgi:TRAP-type C4-dicarboxylate transport system permease small subunit